jgi:uncharacterized membrane protein
MLRLASWLLVALVLGGLAFVGMTAAQLPPTVATHFGAGGVANGWMSRDGYTIFAMLLTLLLPLVVFASVGWLPHRFERFVNLPHRDAWLGPAHRAATQAWLRAFGVGLALLMALLAIGLHAAILAAHARSPPRLDEPAFIAGLVVFVAVVVGAAIAMQMRFRRPPPRR